MIREEDDGYFNNAIDLVDEFYLDEIDKKATDFDDDLNTRSSYPNNQNDTENDLHMTSTPQVTDFLIFNNLA